MEENVITSLQNPRVKHVVALQQKSALRRKEGLFVVEGQREVEHCIASGYEVEEIWWKEESGKRKENTTEGQAGAADNSLSSFHIPLSSKKHLVTPQVYEKMAYRGSTEGILAVVRTKNHGLDTLDAHLSSKKSPLIVVLERVEKPGNLGAVLRSADAAAADAVIVCDPLTDLYNPNLIRSSIGAVFTVPCAVCSSEACIDFLKERGIRILTAQLQDSYDYYAYDMTQPTAIVMGTESTGLTDCWREAADAHIRIPMLGRLDSLNVSVSAAILIYEAVRQRRIVKL